MLELWNRLLGRHDFVLQFYDMLLQGFVFETFFDKLADKNSLFFLQILDRGLELLVVLLKLFHLFLCHFYCWEQLFIHIFYTYV